VNERPTEEWRYLRGGLALVAVLVVTQLTGWMVYSSVHRDPSALELTERCLRREKLLAVDSIGTDPIARSAHGGALSTRVEGNGVHVVFATSDEEAAELATAYLRTGRKIELRLDVRGRVLYVWEKPRRASPTQRQAMYDCWYE
jgi:hypothetical protein